jgi:hypothetical protein
MTTMTMMTTNKMPRTPSRQTEETAISTSGVKVPRTPTALAATTDVDSAEHKQLPKRRFSIKQTTMMWIWQLQFKKIKNTYQITILSFAFVFRPPPFAHAPCPHPTRPNHFSVTPRRRCLCE